MAISASDILSRFSELGRALRVIACVRRFTQRVKGQSTQVSEELNGKEVAAALQAVTVTTQRFNYAEEHRCLINKQPLPATSSLQNLNTFLDQIGIIRACGRVQASASMSYNELHPILLPPACLLARFTHHIALHGGNQLVIRLIRATYWIPRLRHVVRAVIHHCKVCVIHRKRLQTQLMGDLPASSVTFSRPLTYTRVDFAGPFDVKSFAGRSCRISGCGPSRGHSHSDLCGVQQGLSWRLIPPVALHMGVLWEAGVGSGGSKALFQCSMCPGHFLIGGPLLSVSEHEIKASASSILSRWQHLKALNRKACTMRPIISASKLKLKTSNSNVQPESSELSSGLRARLE
ncbi:uncharacterized protein LOC121405365 [Drosophila obscura]|uniref:uncharacterized protein LOC121405365 n=1 Tax=Drosophila obscura TaxID=7282 RepID=UPI001BB1C417|nr:uncharacterized protein LOC121405365 [Drosophila obscura]